VLKLLEKGLIMSKKSGAKSGKKDWTRVIGGNSHEKASNNKQKPLRHEVRPNDPTPPKPTKSKGGGK